MQWLALHNKQPQGLLFILQRKACIRCTLQYAQNWLDLNMADHEKGLCIIAGGGSGS